VAAYERLAARAAVTGDRDTAARALLAHPLVGQWPRSRELLERMLDAEATA
jgi:6-phospho-beta-glucosidase